MLHKNMEQEIVPSDTPTEEEIETPEETELEVGLPADQPEVEPIDEETADAEALKQRNQDLYEQLKKAKGLVRDKDGKWVKKEALQVPKKERVSEDITRTELYSLVKANVPEEDTNEVVIYAKSHGLSVTEALKTPQLKAILKVNQEYRNTAEAANTGSSRRGVSKVPDDVLEASVSQGKLPQSEEDLKRLVKIHIGKKG